MTPEISALLALLHGDSVQKMQETINLCMEKLEAHAFYLENKGLINDFYRFERNHRKYKHSDYEPVSFTEILHRVMPVGDHYSIREVNKTINFDRPGAEITIKILAYPKMSRNPYAMFAGEHLQHPVKERMKLNFQANERIDLDDIMPPRPSADELNRRIANICGEIPQFPEIAVQHFAPPITALHEKVMSEIADTVSKITATSLIPTATHVEDLDTVMRQVTINEEEDVMIPDPYTPPKQIEVQVTLREPECDCDAKMLASTGHADECRWIKWKRSKST